jgi:hypothetical protein
VLRLSVLLLFAGLVAGSVMIHGCFDRPRPACAFWCGEDSACPDGYRCASDQWCKREDVADGFECGPGPAADASPPALDAGPGMDGAPGLDAAPAIDAAPGLDAAAPDAAAPDAAAPDAAPPDANAVGLR